MNEHDDLHKRVLAALDPEGVATDLVTGRAEYLSLELKLLDQVGLAHELDQLISQQNHLWDTATAAVRLLTPIGWAPCGVMPVEESKSAVNFLLVGDQESADEVLVEYWDEDVRLGRPQQQLLSHASLPDTLGINLDARCRLLGKALEHHLAGRFDASIPILFAQIEGLVIDLTGSCFFSMKSSQQAAVTDETLIAGLNEGLPVIRALLSKPVSETGSPGELRRHGILHGRELAYDTRINSVKCFVLLQAVVEWALPRITQRRTRSREGEPS